MNALTLFGLGLWGVIAWDDWVEPIQHPFRLMVLFGLGLILWKLDKLAEKGG